MNSIFKRSLRKQRVKRICYSIVIATLTAVASGFAKADFPYKYVQADYVFGEFDFGDADVSFTGYQLTAQFEISPSIVFGVNYLSLDGDEMQSTLTGMNTLEYEGDGMDVYLFYYSPLSIQTDLLLGARRDMKEFEARVVGEAPAFQTDDDTDYLFAGLRYQLQGLELQGEWSYELDTEDNEDRWSYTLGVVSGIPGQLQLGFTLSPDNRGDVMSVFVRQTY
ncbi:MAG: hypothetical protein AB8B97_10495 [Granulosicoccus sp.]